MQFNKYKNTLYFKLIQSMFCLHIGCVMITSDRGCCLPGSAAIVISACATQSFFTLSVWYRVCQQVVETATPQYDLQHFRGGVGSRPPGAIVVKCCRHQRARTSHCSPTKHFSVVIPLLLLRAHNQHAGVLAVGGGRHCTQVFFVLSFIVHIFIICIFIQLFLTFIICIITSYLLICQRYLGLILLTDFVQAYFETVL